MSSVYQLFFVAGIIKWTSCIQSILMESNSILLRNHPSSFFMDCLAQKPTGTALQSKLHHLPRDRWVTVIQQTPREEKTAHLHEETSGCLRRCVLREVGLGSHSLFHSSPIPSKPYSLCGCKTPWKKNEGLNDCPFSDQNPIFIFFYILLPQHQIKSKSLTRTVYLCWLLRSQTCDLLNSVPLAHNSEGISISPMPAKQNHQISGKMVSMGGYS